SDVPHVFADALTEVVNTPVVELQLTGDVTAPVPHPETPEPELGDDTAPAYGGWKVWLAPAPTGGGGVSIASPPSPPPAGPRANRSFRCPNPFLVPLLDLPPPTSPLRSRARRLRPWRRFSYITPLNAHP